MKKGSEHDVRKGAKRVECIWNQHNATPRAMHSLTTWMYVHEGVGCPCWKMTQKEQDEIDADLAHH